jgi:nitrate reductase NapE component
MQSRVRILIAVLAGYSALVIAFTYPWIRHPLTAVLGLPGDNWDCLWRLWWFKESLLHGHNPFFAPQIFYPEGYNLAAGEITPGTMLAGFPLTALAGEVVAYNVLMLGSFVVAGFAMFLLVRDVARRNAVAFGAGALFAFAPFPSAHAVGHLNIMGYCWIPFIFWALQRATDVRAYGHTPRHRRYALASAAALAIAAYWSLQLAVIGAVGLIVWYLVARPPQMPAGRWFRLFLLVGTAALILVLPLIWFYVNARLHGVEVGFRNLRGIRGAPFLAFILPSPLNSILGGPARRIIGGAPYENSVSYGLVTVLLALWAVRAARDQRHIIRAGVALTVVGIVLGLGPVLMQTDAAFATLPLPFPNSIRVWLGIPVKYQRLPIALPAALVALLPVFSGIRAYQRFALLGNVGLAFLAGIGYQAMASNLTRRSRRAALVGIILLAGIELMRWPFPVSFPGPRAVDRWLAAQRDTFCILEFPLATAQSGPAMYRSRFHGKPTPAGYASFDPKEYSALAESLALLPESTGLPVLYRTRVRYVIIDQHEDTSAHLKAFMSSPDFRLEQVLDSVCVFRLADRSTGRLPRR